MKYVCPKGHKCEAVGFFDKYCEHKFPHEYTKSCNGSCYIKGGIKGAGDCIPYNDIILFKRSKKGGDSDG